MKTFLWLICLGLGIFLPGLTSAKDSASAQIEQLLDPLVEEGKLPAFFVGILKNEEVVFQLGLGATGSQPHPKPDKNTRFALLSLSKPMTSLAVLRLVEKGEIRLDDPLSKFLPEFSSMRVKNDKDVSRPIRIADLFTHTAGLGHSEDFGSAVSKTKSYQKMGLFTLSGLLGGDAAKSSLAKQLAEVAQVPLVSNPGSEFHYSIATDVLGRVAEVVTAQSLADLLQQELFGPLGMNDTGMSVSEEDAVSKMARLVKPLIRTYPTPGQYQRYEPHSKLPRGLTNVGQARGYSSGGSGIISTGSDCLKFLRFLMSDMRLADGSEFIGRDLKERYFTHQLDAALGPTPLAGKLPYAGRDGLSYGWAIRLESGEDLLAEPPAEPDFLYWSGFSSSVLWFNKKENTAGVFLSQIMPSEVFLASRLDEIARKF